MQVKLIFTRKAVHLTHFESEEFWNSVVVYYLEALTTTTATATKTSKK